MDMLERRLHYASNLDYDCMFFIDPEVLPLERYDEFLGDLHDILTLNVSG